MWFVLAASALAAPPALVLFPRIDVEGARRGQTRQMAWMVQQELMAVARRSGFEPAAVDADRCPERGCTSTWIGANLIRDDEGCAVVAVIGPSGQRPAVLVPWVGTVEFAALNVGFGEPPESLVTVRDFQACERLLTGLREGSAPVEDVARSMSAT